MIFKAYQRFKCNNQTEDQMDGLSDNKTWANKILFLKTYIFTRCLPQWNVDFSVSHCGVRMLHLRPGPQERPLHENSIDKEKGWTSVTWGCKVDIEYTLNI